MRNINLYTQETYHTPCKINTRRSTRTHIMVKRLRTKDKNLKAIRENITYYTYTYLHPVRIRANFSSEKTEARKH